MKHKWIIGAVIIIIIFAVILASSININLDSTTNQTNESGVVLKIIAEGPWTVDITDGDGYNSVFNEGNATYNLKDNSTVSATVVKGSNDNANLEAQLIKDGKVISQQSTNSPDGSVTVKM